MHKHTFTKFEFILFCCKFTIIEIDRKFIKTYIVQCRNLSFARKCIIKTEPFASWLCQTGLFFSLATIHKPSRLCAVTAAATTCCNQVQHQTCTQTPVRGHSTTTWTNFHPNLTPSPPRVDKRGQSTNVSVVSQ